MVLHHVAQRACPFVITGSPFYSERFRRGNLNVINVSPVPDRLENRIGEPENQNILRSFLSEEMINSIGLILSKCVSDDFV